MLCIQRLLFTQQSLGTFLLFKKKILLPQQRSAMIMPQKQEAVEHLFVTIRENEATEHFVMDCESMVLGEEGSSGKQNWEKTHT